MIETLPEVLVEWTDGTTHRCTCPTRSYEPYVLVESCDAHPEMKRPRTAKTTVSYRCTRCQQFWEHGTGWKIVTTGEHVLCRECAAKLEAFLKEGAA